MKLLPLNELSHILLIERYLDKYCAIYYDDHHFEIYRYEYLKSFKVICRQATLKSKIIKYHCPIKIGKDVFSPTRNINDKDCGFFNLLKVAEQNEDYEKMLEERNLLDIAKRRYLKHMESVLFHLY